MYPGGKNGSGVYQAIINQIPPHRVYIEGCLGSGAILHMKKPAISSIGIDIDGDVLTAFSGDEVPNLQLIHADVITWLATHAGDGNTISPNTLIYLDPPYLMQTRRQHRRIYRYEMTRADHVRLLKVIKKLHCMVILSGYWSALYEKKLTGWRVETFHTTNRAGDRTTEYLWMNYPKPVELHDYRYLGANFRERERIGRQKIRWINRLKRMDVLQRYALMEVIEELHGDHHAGNDDTTRLCSNSGNSEHRGTLEMAMIAGNAENGDGGSLHRQK